jgi:hypothetical protein
MSFKFSHSKEDNINVYSVIFDDDNKLIKNNWPGLIKNIQEKNFEEIYDTLCIKVNENCEEVPIYLIFIWNLIKHLNVFVIPTYNSYDVLEMLNLEHAEIKWEYNIIDSEGCYNDIGFKLAKSICKINNRTELVEKTNIFNVKTFKDLMNIEKILMNGFETHQEINLFCSINHDYRDNLIKNLTDDKKPLLSNLLSNEDLFINLVIGTDLGYNDSIIIKTIDKIDDKLNFIANEVNYKIKQYEEENKDIKLTDDFLIYFRGLFKI